MTTPQQAMSSKPEASQSIWCVMPVLGHPEYTKAAIADLLAQTVPTRVLVINQGVDDAFRTELDGIAEETPDRVLLWHHDPPLLSLAATWNRALRCVWEAGGEVALVVNNDIRLRSDTVEALVTELEAEDALLVSGVAVGPEDFDPVGASSISKGGPSFSCFLIAKACADRFPFDENMIPAYCEDIDLHRRILLAGEGDRIFSINLPYLHYGSTVLKGLSPEKRAALERRIGQGSRTYYQKKWGGGVNEETYRTPCDPASAVTDGSATTPALQHAQPAQEVV